MCRQNDVITTTAHDISFTTRKQKTKNETHSVCIMQLIMLHITFSLARTLSVSHACDFRLFSDLGELGKGAVSPVATVACWLDA